MQTLEDLFEGTLKDIYYAEHAILKALPKMAKKASSRKLQTAFSTISRRTAMAASIFEPIVVGRCASNGTSE